MITVASKTLLSEYIKKAHVIKALVFVGVTSTYLSPSFLCKLKFLFLKAAKMTTHSKQNPSLQTSIYKLMNYVSHSMSIFFYSLWLILFISFADVLTVLSSAPGACFDLPLEVCSINNKLSGSIQH